MSDADICTLDSEGKHNRATQKKKYNLEGNNTHLS